MKTSTILIALATIFVATASARSLSGVGGSVPPGGYSPPPIVGGSCSTVNPRNVLQCCAAKTRDNVYDAYCERWNLPGALCTSTGPDNAWGCCETKKAKNEFDPSCFDVTPPSPSPSPTPSPTPPSPTPSPTPPSPTPSPTPAVGAACASLGPVYFNRCCIDKKYKNVEDSSCAAASCGLLASANVTECCYQKGAAGMKDDFCFGEPMEGITCSAWPNPKDRLACCLNKFESCPQAYDPSCTGDFSASCVVFNASAPSPAPAHSASS
jgi:hypothetical protein